MAVTLDDLMKLPDQPTPEHLLSLGLLKPPQPQPPPAIPNATIANFSPALPEKFASAIPPEIHPHPAAAKMEPAAAVHPNRGMNDATMARLVAGNSVAAPEMSPVAPAEGSSVFNMPNPQPPNLSFKEKMALPQMSAAVQPGSANYYQGQLERQELAKQNPWGSAENHPGVIGKIGHVLGKIGNTALDVVAPGTAAIIPGTDLHNREVEAETKRNLGAAQERELAGEVEKTREKHEENVADIAQSKLEATEATNKNKDSATLAKSGLKRDENGEIVADEDSPVYKTAQEKLKNAEDLKTNLNAYRQAQTDLVKAKTEVEKAKNDPNSPAFKIAQQKLAMAEQAHSVAAKNLELHETEFANKIKEQELVKPSGQAASRGSAAQAVLDLIPDLKTLVEAHRKDMGPIMGRINRGEVAIGNVDPQIARLYSAMKSFYALQPAVHGFRNAEFVKDFEHALGTLERDPDAFIAGMEGLRPTLESVAKEGKTFHKRIVEGKENAPATGAPEPPKGKATVYDEQGQPHFVFSNKVDDFLKDPKYKGWSKNAPTKQ
jgi:hypothetical protein